MTRSGRFADLLAGPLPWVAAIVGIATFFFRDVVFGGKVFLYRDHLMVYLPRDASFRNAIGEGSIPLWDPLFLGGQPFAANPGRQVFYPPHYLVLIGDLATGYGLFVFFHLIVAAIGMFLLLRSAGARHSSAALGGVTLMLCGPLLSTVHLLPSLCAVAWMPWIGRFTEGFLRTRRPLEFLAATVSLGLLALGGDPVQAPLTGALMVAWSVARQDWGDRREAARAALRDGAAVIAIGVCALLLASVQIWLSFDYARDTIRTEPMTFEMVSHWSFPPARALEFLYPAAFENIAPGYLYPQTGGEALLISIHLGLVACVLAFAGIGRRLPGSGWLVGGLLLSGIIASGSNTPLLRVGYDLGILTSLRYPEKLILPVVVLTIFWSALAFERLREGDEGLRRWTIGLAVSATLVAALFVVTKDSAVAAAVEQARNAYWMKIAVLGGVGAALLAYAARSKKELPAILLIAFVAFADLGFGARRWTPTMPGALLEPPAVTVDLDSDRDSYRIFNYASMEFLDDRTPESMAWFRAINLLLHRNAMFPLSNGIWGYASVLEWDTEHTALVPYVHLQRAMYDVRRTGQPEWMQAFASMSNVRYRAEFRSLASAQLRSEGDALAIRPVDFIRMEDAPRYYFATSIRRATSKEDFVGDLIAGRWERGATWVDMEPFEPAPGEVLQVDESRHRTSLRVRSEGRSYLNIAITPHRYWSATIDGDDATLRVTNVGFQGLEIPAGEHAVELRYENPVLKPALSASLIVLVLLSVGTFVLERRRTVV